MLTQSLDSVDASARQAVAISLGVSLLGGPRRHHRSESRDATRLPTGG